MVSLSPSHLYGEDKAPLSLPSTLLCRVKVVNSHDLIWTSLGMFSQIHDFPSLGFYVLLDQPWICSQPKVINPLFSSLLWKSCKDGSSPQFGLWIQNLSPFFCLWPFEDSVQRISFKEIYFNILLCVKGFCTMISNSISNT